MPKNTNIFCRKEKKYLTDEAALQRFLDSIGDHIRPDVYPASDISNCYYDTPDFLLIRRSLEKPFYKEKLRLRVYGTPREDSLAFIEMKKKCGGIVYKRRVDKPYAQAVELLDPTTPDGSHTQIEKEIRRMFTFYPSLSPAMYVFYHRVAYCDREDPSLRLTVDSNLRYRTERVDLLSGTDGKPLLPPEARLLELKISASVPLWLSKALSENGIFPCSFSKYGRAYRDAFPNHF